MKTEQWDGYNIGLALFIIAVVLIAFFS